MVLLHVVGTIPFFVTHQAWMFVANVCESHLQHNVNVFWFQYILLTWMTKFQVVCTSSKSSLQKNAPLFIFYFIIMCNAFCLTIYICRLLYVVCAQPYMNDDILHAFSISILSSICLSFFVLFFKFLFMLTMAL